MQVHLPQLHNHRQPLFGRRDRQDDLEGSLNSRSSHGSSVGRSKLSVKTNMAVHISCVISTLLYGSETWTTYAGQESRFNTFHLRSIRRILGTSWLDKVTNADVPSRAGLPSMYSQLRQRRLRGLGHVRRVDDGRIPKYIIYGELAFNGTSYQIALCLHHQRLSTLPLELIIVCKPPNCGCTLLNTSGVAHMLSHMTL